MNRRSQAPEIAPEPASPRTVAAAWFARKRSGAMTEQEDRDLADWLEGDPQRRAAYELAERVWRVSEEIRANPAVMAMRERALGRRYWRNWIGAGAAAAAMLAVGAFGGWSLLDRPSLPIAFPMPVSQAGPQQTFRTDVGQRAAVTLPDGSVVTLGTNTVLRTRESPRQRVVELERGEAYFRVAHDRSRPFLVRAAGHTVVAVGTAFEVRVEQRRVAVTLVEGRVRVEAPIGKAGDARAARFVQTTEMEPGSQLIAQEGKPWTVAEVDVGREVSWLTNKLVFQDAPLSKVVAELNRYSVKRIVIRDPAIETATVSGSFRTDDIDESVRALAAYGLASVSTETQDVIELSAAPGTEAQKKEKAM